MADNIDKLIYTLTKDWDDNNPKNINVNTSSSFMVRARCKKCGKPPSIYYYSRVPTKYHDVDGYRIYTKTYQEYTKAINLNWFLSFAPKQLTKIGDFGADLHRGHITISAVAKTKQGRDSKIVEYLTCECGETIWAFNRRSVKTRPDIINRKGKYNYPKKFET